MDGMNKNAYTNALSIQIAKSETCSQNDPENVFHSAKNPHENHGE